MATSLRSYTVTVPTKSRHVNHPICHTNLEIEGPCDQHLSLLSLFQIQSNGMAAWLCHTDHPWWRTCKAPVSGSVARRFKTTLAAKCLHVPTAVRIYVNLLISKTNQWASLFSQVLVILVFSLLLENENSKRLQLNSCGAIFLAISSRWSISSSSAVA